VSKPERAEFGKVQTRARLVGGRFLGSPAMKIVQLHFDR